MPNKKEYVRFKYSEKDLELAVNAVRNGELTQNAASKQYNIPKATLNNKVRQLVPMERKMGPKTVLSEVEETMLSNWIIGKAKVGFPMHSNDVQTAVQKVLLASNRDNPFTNSRPGKKWLSLFLNRRPEISKRNMEIISKARAAVTEEGIRDWFSDLERYIVHENLQEVILDSRRIFNADELGMQFCPETGKLLGPKQYKDFYMISSGPEKESMTVLCNFSASGLGVPPMLVAPYKRIPRDVAASIPDSYFIGRSDSGWMTSETFYEYVANCFFPWLQKNNIQFPIFLFLDGHKSHINVELFEFCREKQIVLYCLLPNATHILQPCDVSIFKPLKTAWKKIILDHKQETNKYLTKANFAPLFKKAFDNAITDNIIKNGFRTCGLFPLDADAVDYSKCISYRRKTLFPPTETQEVKQPTSDDFKVVVKVLNYYYESRLLGNEIQDDGIRDLFKFCQHQICSTSSETNCNGNNNINADIVLTESAIDLMPIEFDDLTYYLNDQTMDNISLEPDTNFNEINDFEEAETKEETNDFATFATKLESHCKLKVSAETHSDSETQNNILEMEKEKKITRRKKSHCVLKVSLETETQNNTLETEKEAHNDVLNQRKKHSIINMDEVSNNDDTKTEKGKEQFNIEDMREEIVELRNAILNRTESNNLSINDKSDKKSVIEVNCDIETNKINNVKNKIDISSEIINEKQYILSTNMCDTNDREHQSVINAKHNNLKGDDLVVEKLQRTFTTSNNKETPKADESVNHTDDTNKTPKINILSNITIPKKSNLTIWKEHLHWPKIETIKKKNETEKMPFAISSKQWKEYYDRKENLKKQKSDNIAIKKLERKKKAEELLKKKTNKRRKIEDKNVRSGPKIKKRKVGVPKTEEDELQNENRKQENDADMPIKIAETENSSIVDEFILGEFVIVVYDGDGKFYPGQIKNTKDEEYEINTMEFSETSKLWKWPRREDKIWYRKNNIFRKIPAPKAGNSRGFYKEDELKKYLPD